MSNMLLAVFLLICLRVDFPKALLLTGNAIRDMLLIAAFLI